MGQIAEGVHTSVFSFCTLFQKTNGIDFTERVSQVRIGRAKELLLDPDRRVIQIACEAGVQLLTRFKGAFKHGVGGSSTDQRNRTLKST